MYVSTRAQTVCSIKISSKTIQVMKFYCSRYSCFQLLKWQNIILIGRQIMQFTQINTSKLLIKQELKINTKTSIILLPNILLNVSWLNKLFQLFQFSSLLLSFTLWIFIIRQQPCSQFSNTHWKGWLKAYFGEIFTYFSGCFCNFFLANIIWVNKKAF